MLCNLSLKRASPMLLFMIFYFSAGTTGTIAGSGQLGPRFSDFEPQMQPLTVANTQGITPVYINRQVLEDINFKQDAMKNLIDAQTKLIKNLQERISAIEMKVNNHGELDERK